MKLTRVAISSPSTSKNKRKLHKEEDVSNSWKFLTKETNFLKLWAAQFFSQISLNALYFILTLKIYTLTGSSVAVSILILTFTAPTIFLGYIAGVYVDQLSLRKVLVTSNLIRALAVILLLVFLNQAYLFFVVVLLLAVATLFFIPAEGSALPALVGEKNLIRANSLFSFTLQVSLVIGFLVGGFSMQRFGEVETIFAILFFFILSMLLNLSLPQNIRSTVQLAEGNVLRRFISGLVFVIAAKKVRDAIFFLTLTTTVILVLATIGPGYIDEVLDMEIDAVASLIIVPAAAGMAVGSFILSYMGEKAGGRFWVNLGLFSLGLTFLALSFVTKIAGTLFAQFFTLGLIFLIGLENALITIPTTTDLQKHTPEEMRGRAYGLLGTFISGVAALPVVLSGAIADLYGVRTVLVVLGIMVFSFGVYRLRPRK